MCEKKTHATSDRRRREVGVWGEGGNDVCQGHGHGHGHARWPRRSRYLVPEGVVAATQGSLGAAAAAAGLGAAGAARGASTGLLFAPASGGCGGRFCAVAPRLEGMRGVVAAEVWRPSGAHAPAVAVGDAPSLSLWAGPRGRLRPPASPTRT